MRCPDAVFVDGDFAIAEEPADNLLESLFRNAEFLAYCLGVGVVAVGQKAAGFFELLHYGVRAIALHDSLVAYGSEVQGNLSVVHDALDIPLHRIADVDALHAACNLQPSCVAVVYEAVHVIGRDFVCSQLHALPNVQFACVHVQETLDFFGSHQAPALFVNQNVDDAAVAPAQVA